MRVLLLMLPHYPVRVLEVHFILGSTLVQMFGAVPAAIGLSVGLLAQGLKRNDFGEGCKK